MASHRISKAMRFVNEIAVSYDGDDCLLWPFSKRKNGYGAITVEYRQTSCHVVVCELVHGPKPEASFEVAHSCGNKACCNPRHLRWATRRDNHADKIGHGTAMRGERHHKAKLTEAEVREIRSLKGKLSQDKIAARFGVCQATVREILHRKIWAWLA